MARPISVSRAKTAEETIRFDEFMSLIDFL
jgi:hypothetical protein